MEFTVLVSIIGSATSVVTLVTALRSKIGLEKSRVQSEYSGLWGMAGVISVLLPILVWIRFTIL